jgi:hypothetical protein
MLTLTRMELVNLTGKRRSDAQARTLEHLGIPFNRRPDGLLVVLRAAASTALGRTVPAPHITVRGGR